MKRIPAYLSMEEAPHEVAAFLNQEPAARSQLKASDYKELKWLVDYWLKSGSNLNRMLQKLGPAELDRLPRHGTFYVQITKGGRPLVIPYPPAGSSRARGIFLQFILSVDAHLLNSPCDKCGRYFVKTTRHQNKYCSNECRSSTTALKSAQKTRAAEHARRVAGAEEAIVEWQRRKRRESWKKWAVNYLREKLGVIITAKSLTRWVNRRELKPPDSPKH